MEIHTQDKFYGGLAEGSRSSYGGIGYQDGIGVDFRTDPDQLTVLPSLAKESSTTVTGLIKWMTEYEGLVFAYDDGGKIYKRATNGTWSSERTVSGGAGQGIAVFNSLNDDALWYAKSSGLGRAKTLTGTIEYNDDYFKSNDVEYDQAGGTYVNTYTTTTSINEGATHKCSFTPSKTNIIGLALAFNTKGTGDITVVVHDSSNVVVASKTFLNADILAGTTNVRFEFGGKYTVTAAASYHFHVYSTVADATVLTTTLNDLSTAGFTTLYYYNALDVDQSNPFNIVSTQLYYTAPAVLDEGDTSKCSFVPTKSTLAAVSILVTANDATSGTHTLTVHDSLDAIVGSATVNGTSFGADKRGYFYRFSFTTPLNLIIDAEYHFHLTTSGGATLRVAGSVAGDFSTAYYKTHFQILTADSQFHPMKEFFNLLLIGNNRFVATVNDSEEYDSERLTFPKGEKVRCIEVIGSYAVISTWRGSAIGDYGESKLYFWDGVAPTYNDVIPIKNGQVQALCNSGDNQLYIIHGTDGQLSVYTGGITPLRTVKNVGNGKDVDIYPGAITIWNNLLHFGISDGTSTTADRVIYSYGTKNKDLYRTMSKDYPISTTNYGSGVRIGCVFGISSTKFLVAWKDTSSGSTVYGVDNISTVYQKKAWIRLSRFSAGNTNLEKGSKTVSIKTGELSKGQRFDVAYRINTKGKFVTFEGGMSYAQDGTAVLKSFDFDQQWLEEEIEITMSCTTKPPILQAVCVDFDLKEEVQIGTVE